jgi:hypothetical protein
MATDFQTKEIQTLSTANVFQDLTPVYTSGDVTVHAIYFSNTDGSNTIDLCLTLFDGGNSEKANILYNVEIEPKSTLVIEKPINLTASLTATEQRKLRVKANDTSIDVVASVLVIT